MDVHVARSRGGKSQCYPPNFCFSWEIRAPILHMVPLTHVSQYSKWHLNPMFQCYKSLLSPVDVTLYLRGISSGAVSVCLSVTSLICIKMAA